MKKKSAFDLTNNEFYNSYAEKFDTIPFKDILPNLILEQIPAKHCSILEIGSGPGALALWLSELGHAVICLEPAEKPAKKALEKGLNVHITRLQDFQTEQKFDLILAISSLIHIPKLELPHEIKKISKFLKSDGVFFASFLEGDEEGLEDPTQTGKNRYFAKFTPQQLNVLLDPYFSIVGMHKIESKKMGHTFLLVSLKPNLLP